MYKKSSVTSTFWFARFFIALVMSLMVAACGGGGGNASGSTGSTAGGSAGSGSVASVGLFMTAPSAVTVAVSAAPTFSIAGGTGPYTASSTDASRVSATVNGSALTISGLSTGSATVYVFDAIGARVSTDVTVGVSSALTGTPLYIAAPSSIKIGASATVGFPVGGGTAPYTVASSDSAAATATISGGTLSVTGVAAGIANISVFDSTGKSVQITANVGSASAAGASLYVTAPSAVTVAAPSSQAYTIGGGQAPYLVSSSNTAIATTSVIGSTLTVNGVAAGTAQILVFDSLGAQVSLSLTVGSAPTKLFTTSPSGVTVSVGAAQTYTVGGGTAPYTVSSSNVGVSTATLVGGNTLNIPGTSAGNVQVVVFDSTGSSVTVNVTVASAGVSTALFTTAPSSVFVSPASLTPYTIGGGASPYTATSNNTGVVTAAVIGSTLNISGVAGGNAVVAVRDAVGATVSINATVGTSTALFTTAPSSVSIAVAATPTYTVGGGSPPYAVSSSNASVATATLSGTTLTVTGVSTGSANISVVDAAGKSVSIAATVGSGAAIGLFTTAPGAITVATGATPTYVIGGGIAPYFATSSNVSFATTDGSSGTNLKINAIAAGSVSIDVRDSAGALVTLAVTVTPVATTPLVVSPSAVTATVGDTLTFSIRGGSPAYTVTANNPSISSLSASSVASSGGTFTATLLNVGTTTVAIVDALGQATTLTLTVNAAVPTLRLSPSAISVGEDYTGNIDLYIYGGNGPYLAYTSDLVLSTVTVGTSPNKITVGPGPGPTRCFTATLTLTVHEQIITVVDSLGASATTKITIQDNTRGGAGCS